MGNYYIKGEVSESNYDSMKKDREYIRSLSGREIGSDILSEAIEAYSRIPPTDGRTQAALLYCAVILFGNILSAALTMLLSAKLKSPFAVIVIMTVITVFPMFVNLSEDVLWIYHSFNLIPVNMFSVHRIIDRYSIGLFGLIVQPYEMMLAFAVVSSMALLPFAYKSFKNHN